MQHDRSQEAAILGKGGAIRVAEGHPWVYRSDLIAVPEAPGFAPVRTRKGRTVGWAAVNPVSLISVRMMHRRDEPIGEEALVARLHAALDFREGLELPDTDALRLVHAEADGLPALVVDRYADVLVVKNGCAALEPHLPALVDALVARLRPRGVLGRLDDPVREREGLPREVTTLYGEVPDEVEVRERGVRLLVSPREGQKTGAFLDQRDNHARLGAVARDRALDVFSYQGGFGLHLARRAASVELVDSSGPALERARRNLELNGLANASLTQADAFERLRELDREGARFAVVSLDPPAFAKRARDLDNAYGAYKELNLRALRILEPGGVLGTSSCSFHVAPADFDRMLADAAADAGRRVRVLGRWGQAPDHPELLGFPESRYLKFTMLQALD